MATIATSTECAVERFEAIYAQVRGNAGSIPWERGRPHQALVNWLNCVVPALVRCGARVVVVGCGLGHDVRELLRRGYDVTAFDCSPTAIEWARRLDPTHAHAFVETDLFHLPARWRHRFDLVVEVNTLQSLPPELHRGALGRIAELMSPHGRALVICRATEQPPLPEQGPPWPLTKPEIVEAAVLAGLVPDGAVSVFSDDVGDGTASTLRMRALFRRG